jgi:hypothetical protein
MRQTKVALLGVCIAVFVWLCWVPLAGNATVCVDDFAWLLMAYSRPTVSQAIAASWSQYMFFRPLDVVANRLVDPLTLDLAPIVPIQMAGLLLLTGGMCRLITITSGRDHFAKACAIVWLWMHPSTQVSIWSAGTCSQTWSSAAGLWLLCEVLSLRQAGSGQSPAAVRVFALSLFGVVFKESFVGWATAAAIVVVMGAVTTVSRRCDRGYKTQLVTTAKTLILILSPSVMWVVARAAASSFGELVLTSNNPHYSFQSPTVVARNVAIALLGMFVQGPVHWARLLPTPWAAVPFVGAALSALIAAQAGRNTKKLANTFFGMSPLGACCGLGVIAVWPLLVIKHVSELYLMGSNALIAMLVGIGASEEIQRLSDARRAGCISGNAPTAGSWHRWIAASILITIAVGGSLSRAYHFGITWEYAKQMRLTAFSALSEAHRMCVDERFSDGPMHSKYIVPPAVAAVLPSTFQAAHLVDRHFPEVVFDCSHLEAPDATAVLKPNLPARVMW